MNKYTKGNTIIEVIIVIAIIAIILAVVGPAVSAFRDKQVLKNTTEEVKVLMDEARINSVSSKGSNFYSVRFEANRAIYFKGNPPVNLSDPETKIITFDSRITIIPSHIVLQGSGTDVVFDRLTGNTSTYGTITLELANDPATKKIISVNNLGVISIASGEASGGGGGGADTTPPVITRLGSTSVTVDVNTSYTDAGATATDNIDGNITSSIVTVNPVDINIVGTYTVTYNVQDTALNNATQVTRTVNVVNPTDSTPPVITLVGTDPITVDVNTSYIDDGATAMDNIDGDITGSIITVNPVNINVVGTYTVTYDVQDSSSNPATQVTRTVNVVDPNVIAA